MKTMVAKLENVGPLSMSKAITSIKDTGEAHDAFELRTWRERMHVDDNGELYIPPNALKNMMGAVAKYLSESVPGKGKATYTKHFEAGIMVTKPLKLGIKADGVPSERLFVPADGKKGGSRRVYKHFPLIMDWKTECEILVFDPILEANPEKVLEYLIHAGKFIGFLRFRPRNGGYYGRYEVKSFTVDNKQYVKNEN